MIKNEIRRQGMFNVIHNALAVKADFIIKKQSGYGETAFSRRKKVWVQDNMLWLVSQEDLVISKLLWAKESYSEMQLGDVRNLLSSVNELDLKYIGDWVSRLGLEEIYGEVKR